MNEVPLNSTHQVKVNALRYWETKNGKTTKWMWVTDLKITPDNVKQIMQGGRSR